MATTLEIVEKAKYCYKNKAFNHCPGDSGEIECFFCPECVISIGERAYNLQMFNMQVENSRPPQ